MWGGAQIGQILGPFMITRGLSCDRVGFGHFGVGGGEGLMTPLTPPPPGYGPVIAPQMNLINYSTATAQYI